MDRLVEFRLADKVNARQLFCMAFKNQNEPDDETVERLANDFARQVPESEFSTAEVLSLLLVYKHSPDDAVANDDKWVASTMKENREKLNRVSSREFDVRIQIRLGRS